MIAYTIGVSGQNLLFAPAVIERFDCYRQRRLWHREAGGQLFARFELPDIVVAEATGPRRSDWRRRHAYWPSRRAEQAEIVERHRDGLHFVGDWHTHPEDTPH
jgi:integrative and conjugative element protein (TIGR02256 family)